MTTPFTKLLLPITLACALVGCTQAEELLASNQPPPVPAETTLVAEPDVVEQDTVIGLTSEVDLFCGVLQRWDGSDWIQVGGLTNRDSNGESTFYEINPETFACPDEGTPMAPTEFKMTGWEPGWYRLCPAFGSRCSNTIELR